MLPFRALKGLKMNFLKDVAGYQVAGGGNLRLVVHNLCFFPLSTDKRQFKKKADTLSSSPSETVHLSDDEA